MRIVAKKTAILRALDRSARADGTALVWPGCHRLHDGARLTIGGARTGVYGYLAVGGGMDAPVRLSSRSTQPSVGLGAFVAEGDVLRAGHDPGGPTERTLPPGDRFGGGAIRIVAGPQRVTWAPSVVRACTFERATRLWARSPMIAMRACGQSRPDRRRV